MKLSLSRLRELLSYDQLNGQFYWCGCRRSDLNGTIAGGLDRQGHIRISIGGKLYGAHRLAWLFVTGEWPSGEIDHIDGDKANNRFENLRACNHQQNNWNRGPQKNNKSGFKGVCLHKPTGQWRANITANGKLYCLGKFPSVTEAAAAYDAAARTYHGEFARPNGV